MAKSNIAEIGIADFHSHILPGADHGSYSVSESLKQLELAKAFGVKKIVATPHFYPDSHTLDAFLKRRELACDMLRGAYHEMEPEIFLGAEVLLCQGLEKMPDIDKLFIEGTRTILLELPYSYFSEDLIVTVSKMIKSGIDVVLAHVDRYPMENIYRMVEVGASVQINAAAICSFFKRRRLRELFEMGAVSAVGSDIHNVDREAYKKFARAINIVGPYAENIKIQTEKLLTNAILIK